MLQYLIILLDDTSTSFCHYENTKTTHRLMPIETLRQGIRFGMMENLMIQFVYPDYELPPEYAEVIESIDHSKIKASPSPSKGGEDDADVLVLNGFQEIGNIDVPMVLRVDKQELQANEAAVIGLIEKAPRLNVVVTDVETFTDVDFEKYKFFLRQLSTNYLKTGKQRESSANKVTKRH